MVFYSNKSQYSIYNRRFLKSFEYCLSQCNCSKQFVLWKTRPKPIFAEKSEILFGSRVFGMGRSSYTKHEYFFLRLSYQGNSWYRMKDKWVVHVLARWKRQSIDTLTVYSLFGKEVTLHLEALTLHTPNIKSACQTVYLWKRWFNDRHTYGIESIIPTTDTAGNNIFFPVIQVP